MNPLLRNQTANGMRATMLGLSICLTIGLALLVGCATPEAPRSGAAPPATAPSTTPASPWLKPPAAMRAQGLPDLPTATLQRIQRYSGVVGHGLVDWHPQRREMLVSHRPPGASATHIFRLRAPLAELERLTDGADSVTFARWEPAGRYIVFARASGGDEADQLYRLDPHTLQAQVFTPPQQRHALLDFDRAQGLAIVTSVPLDRTAVAGTRLQIQTTLWTVDALRPETRRVVAELPGGGWFGARLSPDGTSLAITQYRSASDSEIWLIDMRSGQRRRLLPAPLASGAIAPAATHFVSHWSSDGRALYLASDAASEFRELMRVQVSADGSHVALERLTRHLPWDVEDGALSADGQLLAYQVNVDGRDELHLQDTAANGRHSIPALPAGSVGRLRFHAQLPALAFSVSGPHGPSQIHVLDIVAGRSQAWTQPLVPPGVDLAGLPVQQIVRWSSFDARMISGILSLPPASFAGPRPVVMLMHGGPEGQARQGWLGRLNHLLQDLGVAVLEPNVRGSSGYGKTFLSLDNGRLREDSVKDMAAAIDWLATQPRLDAGKVLVWGGSYGGYMALAAATRLGPRIAAAASTVGISNFVTFLENTESYRRDLRRAEYGDERDPAMRAFLTSISPLTHVQHITKPLLVAQGRNDPRVPWTESEQIVRALQQRGTPVWYLLADNEGHGFARRENADFYFAALSRFIAHTLLPGGAALP